MLKKHLGIAALLLACSIFALSACAQSAPATTPSAQSPPAASTPQATPEPRAAPAAPATPSPEPTLDLNGLSPYDGGTFQIHYPNTWLMLDETVMEDIYDEEWKQNIIESFGEHGAENLDDILAQLDFSAATVIWYDMADSSTEGFQNTANLVINDSGGVTLDQLRSAENLQALQDILVEMYAGLVAGFEVTANMQGKELGGNYYAAYEYAFPTEFGRISGYAATTIHNTSQYTFTYSASEGELDVAICDKMLATLAFAELELRPQNPQMLQYNL